MDFLEIEKKIQTVEGTIDDLEERLLDLTLSQEETDDIYKSLNEQDQRKATLIREREQRELWAQNHLSITIEETEDDWYKGVDSRQFKLEGV